MIELIKPRHLEPGDTVATISPSSGLAGDARYLWRYEQGKKRLTEQFGLKVVEMPNTLKGSDYLYNHPEARAEDFMQAFSDKAIKGVITCIGGEDNIRLLPYMDFNVISQNPKVLTGFSDCTVSNFFCLKAGVSSVYGASLLADFAQNVRIPEYTERYIRKAIFLPQPIGEIAPCEVWSASGDSWDEKDKNSPQIFNPNTGYRTLQGTSVARGRLLGGCLEVLSSLRGTSLFPQSEEFDNVILFLETSPLCPQAWFLEDFLRSLGASGVLSRLRGIVLGKPLGDKHINDYEASLKKVLKEHNLGDLPVMSNLSFGHNAPRICLPIGALAEIDCVRSRFSVLESMVR